MKLLVDVDGPLLDVQPAYWHAYQQAVSELGLARIDPATFWRLVRSAAAEGMLLRNSKPRHWKVFQERLAALLDMDEYVARMVPQPGAARLTSTRPRLALQVVTLHDNASARQQILSQIGSLGAPIVSLAGPAEDRVRRLLGLADRQERSLVLAGHDRLVRAACDAGLPCVGIANGPRTAKCLTQAGASQTFPDLETLLERLRGGPGGLDITRL
ncbi:MAG: HAD family hydrolase [Phycisphaerae bacterium]|nr:HAD family hydrolase [Phycisphaerae bacterium]